MSNIDILNKILSKYEMMEVRRTYTLKERRLPEDFDMDMRNGKWVVQKQT